MDDSRIATNEAARPVPMLCGRARLGLTFITNVFNVDTKPITQQVGKGKSTTTGFHYWAGIAAVLCAGPVDAVIGMFVNGELVWGRGANGEAMATREAESNISVEFGSFEASTYGRFNLYWGTEEQSTSPNLADYTGVQHPAYRGLCYVVFHYLYLGANQTNIPNIEFILERQPAWANNGYDSGGILGDANPLDAVMDILTHPRCGAGAPLSILDGTSFALAGGSLELEKFGVSLLLNRAQETRQVLTQIAEAVDGFFTSLEGKLAFRLARDPIITDSTIVLTVNDFVSRPQFEPASGTDAVNEVRVKFLNRVKDCKEDMRIWRDQSAFAVSGNEPKSLNLERLLLTRITAAETAAKIAGQKAALPALKGSVTLHRRGTLFDDLKPGNLFKIDYDQRPVSWPIFRVTERVLPGPDKPEFSIRFEISYDYISKLNGASRDAADLGEGGGGGDPVEGVPEDDDDEAENDPEIAPLNNVRVVELPLALCPEGKLSLAVLASRGERSTSAFDVHLANVVGGQFLDTYDLVARLGGFALHGFLGADVPANGATIDEETGLVVHLAGVDTNLEDFVSPDLNLHDALSDHYLMFIGGEIFSLAGLSVDEFEEGTAGSYRLYFARGRFATPRQAHASGAEVYIVRRDELLALQHPHFQIGNTSRFKFTPLNTKTILGLDDTEALDVAIAGFILQQFTLQNLRTNGQLGAEATYSTGADFLFEWSLFDAGRDFYASPTITKKIIVEFCNFDGDALAEALVLSGDTTSLSFTNSELFDDLLVISESTIIIKVNYRFQSLFHRINGPVIQQKVTLV